VGPIACSSTESHYESLTELRPSIWDFILTEVQPISPHIKSFLEAEIDSDAIELKELYGASFVKILYLTDLAQKLLSLAEIAISACRDVISGRDSYLCMQRCYLCQR